MKFIVKVLAEHIRQSYELWDDERGNAETFGYNARNDYHTLLRGTVITNYAVIAAMYENNVITFKQFKLLDRYNDRIKAIYRKGI